MTVEKLIKELKKYDENQRVVQVWQDEILGCYEEDILDVLTI